MSTTLWNTEGRAQPHLGGLRKIRFTEEGNSPKGWLSKMMGQWGMENSVQEMIEEWESSMSVHGKANSFQWIEFRENMRQWWRMRMFSALVRIWPSADRYQGDCDAYICIFKIHPRVQDGWLAAGEMGHSRQPEESVKWCGREHGVRQYLVCWINQTHYLDVIGEGVPALKMIWKLPI